MSLHDDFLTKDKVGVNIIANPHTIFLAPTSGTLETINQYVIETLFEKEPVLHYIINGLKRPMPVYKNMTVIVMENRYFSSSNSVYFIYWLNILFFSILWKNNFSFSIEDTKIKYIDGNTIFVETTNAIIPVFAVYDKGQEYFPLVAGYASTVHKVMGQTLKHVTLVFDLRMLSPAVGYVALSRVSSLDNVVPLLRLRRSHFINI